MLLTIDLPKHLGAAIALEAAKRGQTPARYVLDRLADAFALREPPRAARVKLLPEDTTDTRNDD